MQVQETTMLSLHALVTLTYCNTVDFQSNILVSMCIVSMLLIENLNKMCRKKKKEKRVIARTSSYNKPQQKKKQQHRG